MFKIKICGNTSLEDAVAASEAGADAVGFVFYSKSPRAITPRHAASIISRLPSSVTTVGIFVNEDLSVVRQILKDCGIALAQLHGQESPEYCTKLGAASLKAIRIEELQDFYSLAQYEVEAFLLDAYVPGIPGGTGVRVNWKDVRDHAWSRPIILAGGLTADNVGEAISIARPFGVDVSSGVERAPGKKDYAKMASFIAKAKAAFSSDGSETPS